MGLASDWAEAARVVSIPKVAMLARPADTILLTSLFKVLVMTHPTPRDLYLKWAFTLA